MTWRIELCRLGTHPRVPNSGTPPPFVASVYCMRDLIQAIVCVCVCVCVFVSFSSSNVDENFVLSTKSKVIRVIFRWKLAMMFKSKGNNGRFGWASSKSSSTRREKLIGTLIFTISLFVCFVFLQWQHRISPKIPQKMSRKRRNSRGRPCTRVAISFCSIQHLTPPHPSTTNIRQWHFPTDVQLPIKSLKASRQWPHMLSATTVNAPPPLPSTAF